MLLPANQRGGRAEGVEPKQTRGQSLVAFPRQTRCENGDGASVDPIL